MNFKLAFLSVFVVGLSTVANADVLLEPHVAYEFGTFTANTKPAYGGTSSSATTSEINAGARLGFKFMPGIWIAADPQFGFSGKAKGSDGTTSDYTRSQIFADIGYDFTPMRVYVGYAALNEFKSGSTKYTGGTTLKIGAEFVVLTDLAVNVEYHMNGYKNVIDSDSGTTLAVGDVFDSLKESNVYVGLSLPLNFGK